MSVDHSTYQSPFSWRYGSPEMRSLWSESTKRRMMRQVWLALAEAQHDAGLVTEEQLDDLRRTADDIDIDRAAEIEAETRHDVMAEIRTWAEQAPLGGAVIHLGATSADINDTVYPMRVREGLRLIRGRLVAVIEALAERVDETAETVTLGWTHMQPAAPTTVGYRLAMALQDFITDLATLDQVTPLVRAKGFKGAVGTSATYVALLEGTGTSAAEMEADALRHLGIEAWPVTNQVYPRKTDWLVLNALAGIAGSASTLAFNARLLQSPPFGEWSEGFGAKQVGSTAMPWKRNPINAENVSSLSRYVAALPSVAWDNEAGSVLERTLDDSANRRVTLPNAFLATDEVLSRTRSLCAGLIIDESAVAATLDRYGPFAASEAVLIAAAGAGGDRQALHEVIREHSMTAWAAVGRGEPNPLAELLAADPAITAYLEPDTVRQIVGQPEGRVGNAPARARAMADRARRAAGSAS
ncbi:MAG: adenylosuccinate lyase [Anaerolineae bacterium]